MTGAITQLRAWGAMAGMPYGTFDHPSSEIKGQWSNVLLLESSQPTMELTGQEWLTLGSNQERYTVELN